MKKMLIVGDLHCGHLDSITPPQYWNKYTSKMVKDLWYWYKKSLNKVGEVDLAYLGGDLIDGAGAKSGSTELISADLIEQTKIAIECINQIKTKRYKAVRGTNYHTSDQHSQMEDVIMSEFGGDILDIQEFTLDGIAIQGRHHCGSSSIPYSISGPLFKEAYLNNVEKNRDLYIRSHTHKFCQLNNGIFQALTSPCLQLSSAFGRKRCLGNNISIGMVLITVDKGRIMSIEPILYSQNESKSKLIYK